jgi:hypothetical protein
MKADVGAGVGKSGAGRGSAVRLCTLDAQSANHAAARVHAKGGKELTVPQTEPHEIIYFSVYKSQIPVTEQALEIVALRLRKDKSRAARKIELTVCARFANGWQIRKDGSSTSAYRRLPRASRWPARINLGPGSCDEKCL